VRAIDRLPVEERDLAVIVDRTVPSGQVAAVIRASAGPNLAGLTLFDRYQGPPLEAGQVSLAHRLRFQPTDEPLSDAAIEAVVAAITAALAREVGGRIRSGS